MHFRFRIDYLKQKKSIVVKMVVITCCSTIRNCGLPLVWRVDYLVHTSQLQIGGGRGARLGAASSAEGARLEALEAPRGWGLGREPTRGSGGAS